MLSVSYGFLHHFQEKIQSVNTRDVRFLFFPKSMYIKTRSAIRKRLGYVRNPRSLMEGTETLCRDDIGGFTWKPQTSLTKRKRQ